MSADVRIQVAEGGIGEIRVDGVDVARFVTGLGLDVAPDRRPRVVLEGTGRLEAVLESADVTYGRAPVLSRDDRELLERAADAFDDGSPEAERYALLLERLETLSEPDVRDEIP